MDTGRKASLPRQASFTRRDSLVAPMVSVARVKRLLCLGVFFAAGVLCGHLFTQLAGKISEPQRSRLTRGDKIHPAAERAAKIAEAEKLADKNVRNRKKDFSIQFRDYVPRFIFVNCGGRPSSVRLFLDTYPKSPKFVIFSFIPDESYSPMFSVFNSHETITPALCSDKNGSETTELTSITGDVKNISVTTIDLPTWILDNTKADEHIVLKLDVPQRLEKLITDKLKSTSALEWINKFYTASTSKDVIGHDTKAFSVRGQSVETWDEVNGTYSDFTSINPPRNPPSSKAIIKECGNPKLKQHPLFFYSSQLTSALLDSLAVLRTMADMTGGRLKVGVFLPLTYFRAHIQDLEGLYNRMDIGVFLNTTQADADVAYFKVRNELVGVENMFGNVGLILQNVLAGRGLNSSLAKRIVEDRNCVMFVKFIDVVRKRNATVEVPEIPDYEIPVFDMSSPDSHLDVHYLVHTYDENIIPLTECLKYAGKG